MGRLPATIDPLYEPSFPIQVYREPMLEYVNGRQDIQKVKSLPAHSRRVAKDSPGANG